MFVAVFKVWHEGSVVIDSTSNLEVICYTHYLNAFKKGKGEYVNRVIFINGKDKDEYIRRFKCDKRVTILKVIQNQIFYRTQKTFAFQHRYFDENIFSVKPIILEKGFAYWTLAAFEKSTLMNFYKKLRVLEPRAKIELVSIKEKEVNFFAENLFFKLVEPRRQVLLAAWKKGYFEYPRKTDVKKLAKILNVPRSSLQYSLRKAENNLINALLNEII